MSTFRDSNIFSYNFCRIIIWKNSANYTCRILRNSFFASNSISHLRERLYTSDGGLILEWSAKMNYMESKNFIVFFEKSQKSNIPVLWIIFSAIGGFALGALASFMLARKSSAKTLTQVLSKDEKAITDLLIQRKELTQKEIGELLDLSKPKLSKLISGLSKKGIIVVEPFGRKNMVRLAKGAL